MTSLYREICGEEVREDMIGRGVNRVQERDLNTLLTAGAEKGITCSLHVGVIGHWFYYRTYSRTKSHTVKPAHMDSITTSYESIAFKGCGHGFSVQSV